MKKIRAKTDKKDRVLCVSEVGKHIFYYIPVASKERWWLFSTKHFSGPVWNYFRKYGRNLQGRGYSLTLAEIYEFKKRKFKKHAFNGDNRLGGVMERIPVQGDYVIKYEMAEEVGCCNYNNIRYKHSA